MSARKEVVKAEIVLTLDEWKELVALIPKESKYYNILHKVVTTSKGRFGKVKKQNVLVAGSELLNISEKYRKELVKKATPQEMVFRSFLDDFKIKYQFQKIEIYGNKFYIVDFYLPKYNCVVEIDGNHHYTNEYLMSDAERTSHLKELKIAEVYRIKNKDCTRPKLIEWWESLDL